MSELAKPELTKPELAKPELTKPELAKPELTKPELAKPELAKPELAKPELTKPELAKPEPARPEPVPGGPVSTGPASTAPPSTAPASIEPASPQPGDYPWARPGPARVIAVVVTYNRRPLLLEALAAVQAQSRGPDAVIVVDNASTDGTAEAVRSQYPRVRLAPIGRNTGGAGGFAYGMALALADAADLIWLMDDDTMPGPHALLALLAAHGSHPGRPALIASRVLWTNGRPHPMNTPRTKLFASSAEQRAAAAARCLPIRSASFVSVLVDADLCRQRGLPQADYFLWNDDFEFTTRLLRGRAGLLCPASLVVHKTRTFGGSDLDPGPRFFFEVRNKIWTLKSARPLAPAERALYAGATLRRWARTFARSRNRAPLVAALVRGIAAGVRTSPAPTREVLAAAGLTVPPFDGREVAGNQDRAAAGKQGRE